MDKRHRRVKQVIRKLLEANTGLKRVEMDAYEDYFEASGVGDHKELVLAINQARRLVGEAMELLYKFNGNQRLHGDRNE